MIYYRKKRNIKKILVISLLLVGLACFLAYKFLSRVSPVIVSISEEEITAITSNAVREAVSKVLDQYKHEQPEIIVYDDEGNISAVQLNHSLINSLIQEAGLACQNKLAQIGMMGLDVPIGSLSGFVFLSGKGPPVNIKIFPVGSINVRIKSSFISKGINQTNHKVYLSINSDVNIVLPGTNNSISAFSEILICDTLIIGKVPSVYLGTTTTELDFMP